MGCAMLAMVDAEGPAAADALAHAPAWFEQWEESLSRFRPQSELNRLNRGAGEWFAVSETLWQVLRRAQLAERHTRGLVSPVVLDALEAAGYDRSFELLAPPAATNDAPGSGEPPLGSASPDTTRGRAFFTGDIAWDSRRRRVRLPAGMRLDLGGIAKGWAADMAARRLSKAGPALMDAGGDVATCQAASDASGWPIALDNPHPAHSGPLALLVLGRGGVATSGRDYRRWQQGTRAQHHIIDPRNGLPAATDVLCASVAALSAAEAEIAAKVVLILGSRDGLAWVEARPRYAAQLVLDDGRVLQSSRLPGLLWSAPLTAASAGKFQPSSSSTDSPG